MERFTLNNDVQLEKCNYNVCMVVDNETKNFYFIVSDFANVKSFVKRLNCLNKENKDLKHELDNAFILR